MNSSLSILSRHAGGEEVEFHLFLTVVLDGRDSSDVRPPPPGRSTRPDGKHRVGEQVGSRPSLNVTKNRKIFIRS